MATMRLLALLKAEEGFRSQVYLDTKGIPTIGYGTRVDEIELDERTAEKWLLAEVDEKLKRLEMIPEFCSLDSVRQDVIQAMAYQMGVQGVMGFPLMWKAIRERDFDRAAKEMLNSRWARHQSPERALRLARRMETGAWDHLEDGVRSS